MRRLIWGFAGGTYHIVGNLMLRLIYRKAQYIWYQNVPYNVIKENEFPHLMFMFAYKKAVDVWNFEVDSRK